MTTPIADLKTHLLYNPATGALTRKMTMKPVYIERTSSGPRIEMLGRHFHVRPAIWAWMTGAYPQKYRVIALSGDPYDLRWENFHEIPEGYHVCSVCRVEQPKDQFPEWQGRIKRNRCRGCISQHSKKYAHRGVLRKYGLTPTQYAEMLAVQEGVCFICKQPPGKRRLSVDHCHTTGTVRKLLCNPCNIGLGAFTDDPRKLLRAAQYLLGKL